MRLHPLLIFLSLIPLVLLEKPKILTKPTVYRAQVGGTVEFECRTNDLGSMVLLWKEGARVLFAGPMRVRRDDRMEIRGTNLVISSLAQSDAGEYDCEIELDRKGKQPVSIKHRLEILIPPQVHSGSVMGDVLVKKGSRLTVDCLATGNPAPNITWTRLNYDKVIGKSGRLLLTEVSQDDAGVYICTANNGVGQPATRQTNIQVLYKPEVRCDESRVLGGLGVQVVLECRLQGHPLPTIRWYRGSMLLETDNHRYLGHTGSRYQLVINSLREEDFASYTCTAENDLGASSGNITISGVPTTPTFISTPSQERSGNYRINWTSNSFSPITQYTLMYRQIIESPLSDKIYPWTSIQIPGSAPDPSALHNHDQYVPVHSADFLLEHIQPRTEYEVHVRARNTFGESAMSKPFRFHTSVVETMPVESSRKDLANSSKSLFNHAMVVTIVYGLYTIT